MRSPLANPNNHHHQQQVCLSSKPPISAATATTAATTPTNSSSLSNNSTTQFCYEPTSVLDLRRSPSPVLGGGGGGTHFPALSDEQCWVDLDHPHHLLMEDWDPNYSMTLGFEDHHHHHHHQDSFKTLPQSQSQSQSQSQFLDSPNPILPTNPSPNFMLTPQPQPPFLLGHDDFVPSNPQFINFSNPNTTNFNYQDFESTNSNSATSTVFDRLIRAAEAVESNDLHLAQVILARLNQNQNQSQQQQQAEKPLLRSALLFKEALQSLLLSGSTISSSSSSSSTDTIEKIRAYKSFSEVSPITMFANFTANQALLETLDSATSLHIIDFDIGLGGHWSSFIQELATKSTSPNLRITAVVSESSSLEANLVRDNLRQFAHHLGIPFHIDFLFFRSSSFDLLHLFNSLRILNSDILAVNLSPSIFRHLPAPADFLRFLRRLSPRITLFVDSDGWRDASSSSGAAGGPHSFRRNFVNGVQFYSLLLDSLDAVSNGNIELVRRIERFLIQPRVCAALSALAGGCVLPWREMFSAAGMSPVPFSHFTEAQAEWLVRRTQLRNFHVATRQGEMLLCWHGSLLLSTSVWRC
ncbi:hypothetical protein Sjap_010423 [Stephania japonica]|uniref:Scarecrow-like protein 15 n=1 Tax=Stephania japonica TaxID=461633 RepID=A0AAP0J9E6_9MAGN